MQWVMCKSCVKRFSKIYAWTVEKSEMNTHIILTSSTVSAGKLTMSSERPVRKLEARMSLVSSVCSHHRSSVLSRETDLASSGTSRFSRHTVSGTVELN